MMSVEFELAITLLLVIGGIFIFIGSFLVVVVKSPRQIPRRYHSGLQPILRRLDSDKWRNLHLIYLGGIFQAQIEIRLFRVSIQLIDFSSVHFAQKNVIKTLRGLVSK